MPYERLRQTSALFLLGLALVACAQKVESEKVTVGNIGPNLICSAQRVDPVVQVNLTGSGFAPMPTNVLKKPPVLILPSVELVKVQDLMGQTATGTDILFSGDPADDFSENVAWVSRQQLVLNVTDADPVVDLDAGLYDVTVTNPDGDHDVVVSKGLAVVDPPTISSVEPMPPALCTAQQPRSLVLHGQNFLQVGSTFPTVTLTAAGQDHDFTADAADGCTPIPGTYADSTLQLCTTITVTLPGQPDLPAGVYDLKVTSPAPASCYSSEPFKVDIVEPPAVTMITPASVCVEQGGQAVTITGTSFVQVSGVQPSVVLTDAAGNAKTYLADSTDMCTAPVGVPADFGIQVCTSLVFTIPQTDLAVGSYDLAVTNPDPVGCASPSTPFAINPPPDVTSLAPATVCTGGSTLVATGTGFHGTDSAQLLCATTVQSTGAQVNADGTQLTLQFGAGIGPGEVCDLVVSSQDGCEDAAPHLTVTGTQGPILFNVDPYVIPSGSATKVLLLVTTVEGTPTVKMWPGTDTSLAVTLDASVVPDTDGSPKILATIPADTMPGEYSIAVEDQSGCSTSISGAITVTDNVTISTGTVSPSFGQDSEATAITITLGAAASTGTPRAFLVPSGDLPLVQLESVTTLDSMTLTAVVPANTGAGTYDVVIVWPDGTVAVLSAAYTSVSTTPPRIDDVVPQSIVQTNGQMLTITGTGFVSSTVTLICETGSGLRTLTSSGAPCDASPCTATVDAGSLASGDICVVRVTNADGAYDEFSAIGVTVSSGKLSNPVAGTALNVGRRALAAAAVKATSASRFVYAIGGDDGTTANAFDSVEFAPVDVFGNMGAWQMSAESLSVARTFPASATIGRYIYVLGGNDGGGALDSAERALVLSPEEVPDVNDVDLCLAGTGTPCFSMAGISAGLEPGTYSYRVAALIDATDPENLGGETLPSEPTILRLQDVAGLNAAVRIGWTAPVDSLGAALSGVIGYRIYRTPKDGVPGSDEQLLAEVGATALDYIDDGTATLDSATTPLPPGSTSAWQGLPIMGVPREAAAAAAAPDPSAPDTTWYVYALLGRSGNTAYPSYEFLPVTIEANGRQTVAASWTPGTSAVTVGRAELGAWVVDKVVSQAIADETHYIYVGQGINAKNIDVASVLAGGQLSSFTAVSTLSDGRYGYGTAAAAGKLFAFGGFTSSVQQDAWGTTISSPPTLDNWSNEALAMTTPRYLMGSTIQSAFIFLIGGTTGTDALTSTETVVW